jgi:hypothetical protein
MAAIKPTTNLLSLRIIVSTITGLFLLALLVSQSGATPAGQARANTLDAHTPVAAHADNGETKLTEPTMPLEKLLNKDGTLNLDTGFSGSLDPSG